MHQSSTYAQCPETVEEEGLHGLIDLLPLCSAAAVIHSMEVHFMVILHLQHCLYVMECVFVHVQWCVRGCMCVCVWFYIFITLPLYLYTRTLASEKCPFQAFCTHITGPITDIGGETSQTEQVCENCILFCKRVLHITTTFASVKEQSATHVWQSYRCFKFVLRF